MKILAIESSCDETAAAVIGDNAEVLSNIVVSQIDIFKAYGGVIPEVAARSHLEAILPVVHKALDDARLTKDDIDYIAVTHAPGLLGSLLIGTLTARMLAILWAKPLYAVHHLKSHIYSNWLSDASSSQITSLESGADAVDAVQDISLKSVKKPFPKFPLLALVISGGHTQIIYMPEHNQFEIIGTTRDDAVGECFDKVAKILGLPYPGGPSIAKAAEQGDSDKYHFPHPKIDGLDFSFSGLKTAVLRAVQAECGLPITTPSYELASHLTEQQKADFAASFQSTACDILLEKIQIALRGHPEARSAVFAGGVSANQLLRQKALVGLKNSLKRDFSAYGKADNAKKGQNQPQLAPKGPKTVSSDDFAIFFPEPKFSGDNAAMVGVAAYFEILSGVEPTDPYSLNILPRTPIH